jgi:hypothetical protein
MRLDILLFLPNPDKPESNTLYVRPQKTQNTTEGKKSLSVKICAVLWLKQFVASCRASIFVFGTQELINEKQYFPDFLSSRYFILIA